MDQVMPVENQLGTVTDEKFISNTPKEQLLIKIRHKKENELSERLYKNLRNAEGIVVGAHSQLAKNLYSLTHDDIKRLSDEEFWHLTSMISEKARFFYILALLTLRVASTFNGTVDEGYNYHKFLCQLKKYKNDPNYFPLERYRTYWGT